MNYTTITIEEEQQVMTIWLNRPDMRNAMNDTMIAELIDAFHTANQSPTVRVIVLRGKGKVFCAGADLNWMKHVAAYTYEENYKESLQLANCFDTIYHSPKPTIAVVQGAAMGGANGLLAACDFAYCFDDTIFAFSEVKIGLIPATISPYIIKRIGEYGARELLLTGKKISGTDAEKFGLVNRCLPPASIEQQVSATIAELLSSGPEAIRQCKQLIDTVINKIPFENAIAHTAEQIAIARASKEGQEGMKAFLEKRKPNWNSEK